MKQIANDLKLQMFSDSMLCKIFPRIGNLFGKYALRGNVCGKFISIYTTKFPARGQFPLRLVVRTDLSTGEKFNIRMGAKPFLVCLHKIFNGNIFCSRNPILDSRLLFSTDNPQLLQAIIRYEEIEEHLCNIWNGKRHGGVLMLNADSIIYHEPFRIIKQATRKRIGCVVQLICDIADVIKIFVSGKGDQSHGGNFLTGNLPKTGIEC
ncbi:MAG: hypothetical protein LBI56_04200 [Puniceicoccales bacterium]|jgi:hypothetical protein|nr:hypothetical protein [Puniceicoccales bacterium]